VPDRTEVVQDRVDVPSRQTRLGLVPKQGVLVLEHEWHGKGDLETTSANFGEQSIRRAPIRTQPGDQDVCVDYDPWWLRHGSVDDTIAWSGSPCAPRDVCPTPGISCKAPICSGFVSFIPLFDCAVRPHGLPDVPSRWLATPRRPSTERTLPRRTILSTRLVLGDEVEPGDEGSETEEAVAPPLAIRV
jgi:hypothetical protein